ncbi:MAG: MarR family transcriptional regulator [Sandaracinaceae bacterium]|nr:MarR family transcriptional regulator [Sandaracinaceae bacterium]
MTKHRFFYLLNLARHRVNKHVDRVALDELGISAAWLGALFVIGGQPGASQRELARSLGYNESAITALLRKLVDAELVERAPSPSDARVMQLQLTERGASLAKRGKPLLKRFNAMLMDGFDEPELDVAARFLENAIERFGPEGR